MKVLEEYQDVSDQAEGYGEAENRSLQSAESGSREHEEGKFDNGQIVRWKRIEKNLLDY